jgi:hypothetical protein
MKVGDLVRWKSEEYPDLGLVVKILRRPPEFGAHRCYIHWIAQPEDNGLYRIDNVMLDWDIKNESR